MIQKTDNLTGALEVIDHTHGEVHEGHHFFIKDFFTNSLDAEIKRFLFVAPASPADKWAHIAAIFDSSSEYTIEAFEGVVYSDEGDAITPLNSNRNLSTASILGCYSEPTITNENLRLWGKKIGSGRNPGNEKRGDLEIIFKANTAYLLKVTKNSAGASWFDYNIQWYEETNSKDYQ